MIALLLTLIATAAAFDCRCDCDGMLLPKHEVKDCAECSADSCKAKYESECGSATQTGFMCDASSSGETDNFFTCDTTQLADALTCVFGLGSECPLLITPADSKYCSCKQKGLDCQRSAGCKPNKQTEAQVAACKKECPDANYCNGAESLVTSTVALVAALAALRI